MVGFSMFLVLVSVSVPFYPQWMIVNFVYVVEWSPFGKELLIRLII